MQRNQTMPKCQAQRNGYDMKCARCGLAWDVKDNDRPDCKVVPVKLVERVGDRKFPMRAKL